MSDPSDGGGTVVSRSGRTSQAGGPGAHSRTRTAVALWMLAALALPALGVLAVPPGAGVSPRFELAGMETSPFPSDFLTVPDDAQATGLRVNLPKPDCAQRPSDCEDVDVLNTLDGFNLQPRLAIPFSGAIDPSSVTSDTVFLLALDGGKPAARVGINQVVWDPATRVLFAESDELLSQASRYALIVTTGVRDAAGDPIVSSTQFNGFRKHPANDGEAHRYKQALLDALYAARHAGTPEKEIAVASVFTTQSITAVSERMRDYVRSLNASSDFGLGPGGSRTRFAFSQVKSIVFRQQVRTVAAPNQFSNSPNLVTPLKFVPGVVGTLAYGRVTIPIFLQPDGTFGPVGTAAGLPPVVRTETLYFNLQLPSGTKPADGWPVAMIGIGANQNKEQFPTLLAAKLAQNAIATLTINPVGRGGGPLGTNLLTLTDNSVVTFLAGGRGRDTNGDTNIGTAEGGDALGASRLLNRRDTTRQTVLDHIAVARAIELGMDVDGDGAADLDADRISFLSWSYGAVYGIQVVALDPLFKVGVFNAPGGPFIDNQRFGGGRNTVGQALAARVPSLINVGGITFNENLPVRGQPPMTNTVAGAVAIQQYIDRAEWALQPGDPVAYAPHLRAEPLGGSAARVVLVQIAKGDMTVPNPANSAVIRAGGLEAVTTFYRHDLAFAANPLMQKNPHGFLTVGVTDPTFAAVSRGAQDQAGRFLASGGLAVLHPTPSGYLEVPINLPLPEAQNFIP